MHSPVLVFQILAVPSSLPVARRDPFVGWKATLLTLSLCPRNASVDVLDRIHPMVARILRVCLTISYSIFFFSSTTAEGVCSLQVL